MNVTCPSCETVYRVDPAKVPAGGVRARCAVCSNVFPVNASVATPPMAPAPATPKPPPVAPPPPAPAPAPPRAPAMPRFSGPISAPTSPPAPPAAPPRAPPPPAPRAAPAPTAPAMRPTAPPAAPPPRAAPPPAPRAPAAPAAPPAPAAPAAPAGAAPGQRMTSPLRPVNPFMVQDPKQKARRLARALVSDMLVYHPEKRQQGIRDGTLPQLFKDEIQKSWLEYTEQVGAELAQSTPFWTEALNEILGGGHKLF